jgi:nitroreductase
MERKSEYTILSAILNRWSPRAFIPEEISDEKLFAMFDAARWAPSAYNVQPWRFIYAKRETPAWDKLFNLMVEFNQGWTKNASALIVIVAKTTSDDGKPAPTSTFDTGAAWQNLALEAQHQGYYAHGMSGFDYDKAKTSLNIPDDFEVLAMAAIGKKGDKDSLPEMLQEREAPSDRKPVKELIFEGSM